MSPSGTDDSAAMKATRAGDAIGAVLSRQSADSTWGEDVRVAGGETHGPVFSGGACSTGTIDPAAM